MHHLFRRAAAMAMVSLALSRPTGPRLRRFFAVKALSWCSPAHESKKIAHEATIDEAGPHEVLKPITRFGIVAAMSSNRIIGIDNKLPWRLPKDRKAFKNLTEKTVLIVGRRTFEENPLRRHINHASASVVLSRTLDKDIEDSSLRIARSFPEALHIARLLTEELAIDDTTGSSIQCWVAGGERVYHEALVHPNASELRLTIVDNEIQALADQQVARFPANYRWDSKFKEVAKERDVEGGLTMTQHIFRRLSGRR